MSTLPSNGSNIPDVDYSLTVMDSWARGAKHDGGPSKACELAAASIRWQKAEIERLRGTIDRVENQLFALASGLEGARQRRGSPETPEYRKWPGEPPHCMSCSCGMTDEQKRTVPEADYLRIHRELMDLKYPSGRPSEKASEQPSPVDDAEFGTTEWRAANPESERGPRG